eukprot:COSAG02_NODE_11_length_58539_cov_103.119473_27_plen_135_part_00
MSGTDVVEYLFKLSTLLTVLSWLMWLATKWWDSGKKEDLLKEALDKVLGKYVQNLDPRALSADFLKGEINLGGEGYESALLLKRTALSQLKCAHFCLSTSECVATVSRHVHAGCPCLSWLDALEKLQSISPQPS